MSRRSITRPTARKRSSVGSSGLSQHFNSARQVTAGSTSLVCDTWHPSLIAYLINALTTAKDRVLSLLKKIVRGQLRVEFEDEIWDFGEPYTLSHIDGPPRQLSATIKIVKDGVWTRLFLHADFGFAGTPSSARIHPDFLLNEGINSDAYMLDEVEVDSLNNLFRVCLLRFPFGMTLVTYLFPPQDFHSKSQDTE